MSALTERTYNGHRLFLPCPSCIQDATGKWHCPCFPQPITEILLGLTIFGIIPECHNCHAFITTCDLCWHIDYEVGLAILHDAEDEMHERRLREALSKMQVSANVTEEQAEQDRPAFRAPLPLDPTMSPGQIPREWIEDLDEGFTGGPGDLSPNETLTPEDDLPEGFEWDLDSWNDAGGYDIKKIPQPATPAPAQAAAPSSLRWGLQGRAERCVPVWGEQGGLNGQGGFGDKGSDASPGQEAQGAGMGQEEDGAEEMEIEEYGEDVLCY